MSVEEPQKFSWFQNRKTKKFLGISLKLTQSFHVNMRNFTVDLEFNNYFLDSWVIYKALVTALLSTLTTNNYSVALLFQHS